MARNVEIKARVSDLPALRTRVDPQGLGPAEILRQEDVFFHVPEGRLKLRIFSPERGQLIFYRRADRGGPRLSDYTISFTAEPDSLREVLAGACGVRGVVRKTRELYLAGPTRIHLDTVENLGTFLEIEVVLEPEDPLEKGQALAAEWMDRLGVHDRDLVSQAYIDLLVPGQALTGAEPGETF